LNINKTKFGIFAILVAFFMLFSISSVSANTGISISSPDLFISDEKLEANNTAANEYVGIRINKNALNNNKKVPAKFKDYANVNKFQVIKGSKISYRAVVNVDGDIQMATNLKNGKTKKASINFGDKSKTKKGIGWISHTYKKTGWYLIKVNMDGTCKGYTFFGTETNGTGTIKNGTKYYLVYVADKSQLTYTKIAITAKSQKDVTAYQKKGQINYLAITVKNIGTKNTKSTSISLFYADAKNLALNKAVVDKKLKKFTGTAKLKSLKPGKSAVVVVKFTIPKKYANKKIILRLDSANKNTNQASKANNIYLVN